MANNLPNKQTPDTSSVKKNQRRTLMLLVVGLLALVWVISAFFSGNVGSSRKVKKNANETAMAFGDPLNHVDESKIWVERAQNSLEKEEKTTQSLQDQLQQLKEAKDAADKQNQYQNDQLTNLQNQVKNLTQRVGGHADVPGSGQTPFSADVTVPGPMVDG